jgi:co-chaperonin GroES (HSP10)
MNTLKLFGERVAVITVEEEIKGEIFLPEERNRNYELGRIIAVGDCKNLEGAQKPAWASVGDMVLYQLIGPQDQNSKFVMDGKAIRILNQNDLLGRLSNPLVCLENFQILGQWVLLRANLEQVSTIHIPARYVPPQNYRFHVVQKGDGVSIPLDVGQEVYAERNRTTHLEIKPSNPETPVSDQVFGFCHYQWVYGILENNGTPEQPS